MADYGFSNGPPSTSTTMSVTTVRRWSNSWSIIDFQMDLQIQVTVRVLWRYDRGPIGGRLWIFKWTSDYKYHYECHHSTTEVQFVVDYGFSNGPPSTSNTTSVTTVWRRSNWWSIMDFQMDLQIQRSNWWSIIDLQMDLQIQVPLRVWWMTVGHRSNSWSILDFQMDLRIQVTVRLWWR